MSIETEDQGDGRSRVHELRVKASAVAYVTVQREQDGTYVATLRRVGATLYPDQTRTVSAPTKEGAVRKALQRHGITLNQTLPPDLGEWIVVGDVFTDADGHEYSEGFYLIRGGQIRAHVECGSGTGYDKAHVFDADGNCVYAAEYGLGEDESHDPDDGYFTHARKWCEARLDEVST